MKRINWESCWITLRHKIKDRTSWGKVMLADLMDDIEYIELINTEDNHGTDGTQHSNSQRLG